MDDKIKVIDNEMYIEKPFAEIHELKNMPINNYNTIRLYCQQFPDVFLFQIRTYGPTSGRKKGVKKNMCANVSVTIEQVEEMLKFMKGFKH